MFWENTLINSWPGCAHGYAHNWISIRQILAVKAGADALPLTRNYSRLKAWAA